MHNRDAFTVYYVLLLLGCLWFLVKLLVPRRSDNKTGDPFSCTLCDSSCSSDRLCTTLTLRAGGAMVSFGVLKCTWMITCAYRTLEDNQCDCFCSLLAASSEALFCLTTLWSNGYILCTDCRNRWARSECDGGVLFRFMKWVLEHIALWTARMR